MKSFWVIGGGVMQIPLIEEVRKLGMKAIVTDLNPRCAARQQADLFFPINIFDIERHVTCAEELTAQGEEIAGVLAAGVDAPETMAVLATTLGLPAVDPAIAHIVNNKDKFRAKLQQLGYPVPKFHVMSEGDLARVEQVVSEVGYPLIVKNTDSSGSRGTKIFYEPDLESVREAVKVAIRVSRSQRALIEQFWHGCEQTVETLFDVNGEFHPCFITDRVFDTSQGFALETGLRHPSSLSQATQREMYDLAHRVACDFGINIGAAKYDMILTDEGPRIIEMTVRLSGGFDCQYLVPAATGKNILRAALLTALGRPFPAELLRDTKGRVGLSGSLWPKPGRIIAIDGIEEAQNAPGFEQLFFRYEVGDEIEPYTDCTKRACFMLVTGRDEQDARKNLEYVRNAVRIETV